MSNYPTTLDDDTTLPIVNDNLTEIGGEAINSLRDAVFNIEQYVGTNSFGVSIEARLGLLVNQQGMINSSVITSLGLVTLPVTNSQIADNAGIPESKLHLDYRTQDLFNYIRDLSRDVNLAIGWINVSGVKLEPHLIGAIYRHDLAQIDVAPTSTQFLNNKFRVNRDNTDAYTVINDMNNELLAHQWADGSPFGVLQNVVTNDGSVYPSYYAHVASGIYVDTSRFQTIPQSDQDVQAVLEYIDSSSILLLGTRIQNLYSNGISVNSRSSTLQTDGYGQPIVPVTPATAFLLFPNGSAASPIDDISHGDDIIQFNPTDGYTFDSQFALVQPGDIIRINYGTIEVSFVIEGKKYIPGTGGAASQFFIRIAGRNLFNSTSAMARIDRPLFNNNKYGVLAVAAVNNPLTGVPSSLIVGNPRGAQVLGVGFNADQIDNLHYLLYLILYPTGSPSDGYNILPGIDITGNQGSTPGAYDLDSIVNSTNTAFRRAGYNYRFIAFQYQGQFGVMLADAYGGAAFSVVNANVIQSGPGAGQYDPIATGINFPNNAVSALPTNLQGTFNVTNSSMAVTASVSQTGFLFTGSAVTFGSQPGVTYTIATVAGTAITLTANYTGTSNGATTAALTSASIPDPLGFGFSGANIASPPFMSSYSDVNAAQLPTRIFVPLRRNNYYVNGVEKDNLNLQVGQALDTFGDGYWVATVNGVTAFPGSRVQVSYNIPLFLTTSDLKVGKTIVVQPLGESGITNFGRFIITNINYEDGPPVSTNIVVYDAAHATGSSPVPVLPLGSQIAIYFNSDSVAFDAENVSDFSNYVPPTVNFKRNFEVYIDEFANTYTHERARLSLSGTVTINNTTLFGSTSLTTTNSAGINLVSISPKLKGFVIGSLTKVNLQILGYDQATGIFSGYLCSYDGTNITNTGPLTFGQKGQVTRFYDYTNIDYIDIIFDDSVSSTSFPAEITSPVNIDIQLFPTLSLDEEIMLLGTCQFNDASGLITYQEDARQFGNISEEQLSTSAIDFIEAPTRELHENGIIRGFDVLSQTTSTITFSGGTALVNGKIIQVNPQTVTIPVVFEALPTVVGGQPTITSTVNTITWFICINDKAEIELVASTDFDPIGPFITQYQAAALNHLRLFYAMNPNAISPVPYQIRGTYFANVVLLQKDLAPIATAAALVTNPGGAFVVSSLFVVDARRYVTNGYGGLIEPLTLGASASFRSIAAVNNWLIQFNELISSFSAQANPISNKIIIKGHVSILETTLMGFLNTRVYIEGDGGVFDIFSPTGFQITGNVNFSKLLFNYYYDPTVIYDPLGYNTLIGTFNVINGSNTILTTSSQVGILSTGSVISFGSQFGAIYIVLSVNSGSVILTTNYSGMNNSTSTASYSGYNTANWINSGKGAIYMSVATAARNLSIKDCHFIWIPSVAGAAPLFTTTTSTSINRHPFINIELAQPTITAATILQGIEISGNTFAEETLVTFTPAAQNTVRAAISFVSTSTSTAQIYNIKLIDVIIRDNVCDKDQMIAIVPTYSTTPGMIANTINATDVLIDNNTCGTISVFTQYFSPFETLGTFTFNFLNFTLDKNNGLIIRGNTCKYIHSTDSTGADLTFASTNVGVISTGSIIISDNIVSWIRLPLATAFVGGSPCIIKNNIMNGYDSNFLKLFGSPSNNLFNSAIYIDYIGTAPGPVSNPIIDGNLINVGFYETITPPITQYTYDVGIFVTYHDANIINNLITNLMITNSVINPVGVWLETFSGASVHSTINNNKFYRIDSSWTAYIDLGDNGSHTVSDNFFDQLTPFGAYPTNFESQIIGNAINNSSIRGNVNLIVAEAISLADDKLTVFPFAGAAAQSVTGPAQTAEILFDDQDGATAATFAVVRFTQNGGLGATAGSTSNYVAGFDVAGVAPSAKNIGFSVPLSNRLPPGVKILGFQMGVWVKIGGAWTFDTSSTANNAVTLTVNIYHDNTSSGTAGLGITDVKNNIVPTAFPIIDTDNSLRASFSSTILLGTVPSSGTNPNGGTYNIITPGTIQIATQFMNIVPTLSMVTGANYRIGAQVDLNWKRLLNPGTSSDNMTWYMSPLLITYTW